MHLSKVFWETENELEVNGAAGLAGDLTAASAVIKRGAGKKEKKCT